MLEINKENKEQIDERIVMMQDRIADNVECGVNFYLMASLLQALSLSGNVAVLELTKNIFSNSLNILKKDCAKIAGVPDIKQAEAFHVEDLIDKCAAPYSMVLEQCCKLPTK